MHHWATQLPPWFWILAGFVLGYWAAYLLQSILNFVPRPATHATIRQVEGAYMVNGVLSGGSGKFQVTYNGALAAGAVPSWSASDPSIVLAPSPDGFTCDAAVPAGSPLPSFSLSATAIASDGNPVIASAGVPVLLPPPVPATAGVIDQIA